MWQPLTHPSCIASPKPCDSFESPADMQYVGHDGRSPDATGLPTDAIPGALPMGFPHEPLRTLPPVFLRGAGYDLMRAALSGVQGWRGWTAALLALLRNRHCLISS